MALVAFCISLLTRAVVVFGGGQRQEHLAVLVLCVGHSQGNSENTLSLGSSICLLSWLKFIEVRLLWWRCLRVIPMLIRKMEQAGLKEGSK